jgi:hypothetical protein
MDMNSGSVSSYLHWDPNRTDITITESELEQIRSASTNIWKDLFLLFSPISITCLVNAFSLTPNPFELTLPLFLNYLIGFLTLLLSCAFLFAWRKTGPNVDRMIHNIMNKPIYKIEVSQTGAEGIPSVLLQQVEGITNTKRTSRKKKRR